jgi:hypothetical protein
VCDQEIVVPFLLGVRVLFLHKRVQTGSGDHVASYSVGAGDIQYNAEKTTRQLLVKVTGISEVYSPMELFLGFDSVGF